jgi:hypothetical protein
VATFTFYDDDGQLRTEIVDEDLARRLIEEQTRRKDG